ncbi:MAG: PD40 domain-containing protein [Simkaniaceae bacterium]|nr:PD40 domain-containing protein [Simkaniaceae bacterium]
MMRFFLIFCFACLPSLFGKEIAVPLATKDPLIPIYCNHFDEKLEAIFLFDLNHTGYTKTLIHTPEREERSLMARFNPHMWNIDHIHHLIQVRKEDKTLFFTLYTTKDPGGRSLGSVHVSGRPSEDRHAIHLITDHLMKALFNLPGIASSRLMYAMQIGEGEQTRSEIWTSDYDGQNAAQLTHENHYCINPSFIPGNKTHFIYINFKQGPPKIYIAPFSTGVGAPFLSLRGNQLLPAFSRNGNKIAFISDASGRADLFVQSFDPASGPLGIPLQAYTFPHSVQASPCFSPNGEKIAFVSDKEKTPCIYLISTPKYSHNNTLPTTIKLTSKYRENTCPNWSPDGKKLAYSARVDGVRQIMVYDFASEEEIQLTSGPGHKENPVWGPNSFHLVFNSVDPGASELYLINLHQRKPLKISHGPGRKHYPAWGEK